MEGIPGRKVRVRVRVGVRVRVYQVEVKEIWAHVKTLTCSTKPSGSALLSWKLKSVRLIFQGAWPLPVLSSLQWWDSMKSSKRKKRRSCQANSLQLLLEGRLRMAAAEEEEEAVVEVEAEVEDEEDEEGAGGAMAGPTESAATSAAKSAAALAAVSSVIMPSTRDLRATLSATETLPFLDWGRMQGGGGRFAKWGAWANIIMIETLLKEDRDWGY